MNWPKITLSSIMKRRARSILSDANDKVRIKLQEMPKLLPATENNEKPFSFYESTRQRFANELIAIREKHQLNSIVMVLDLCSARIISKLFTVPELVSYNVVFLQRLEVIRKPLDHHAIYFITPNEASITCMLKDFQSESKPQYRKIHVLFTSWLDPRLMNKVAANKNFIKRLVRHSFKEFYCNFEIISDNCVHFNQPYLAPAFSRQSPREEEIRAEISRKIVGLIAGYDSLLTVRFFFPKNSANKVAERVANQAAKEVKNYLYRLLENKSPAINPKAQDLTVLVLDRSVDVVTPVMHGYTYESLLYDLLEEKQYEKLPKQIFDQFRYRHISHALTQLPPRLDQVARELKGGKLQALDIKQKFELQQQLSVHITLVMKIWQKFQEKRLRDIGELELSMATGVTEESKQTSSSEIVNQAIQLIRTCEVLSIHEKIRLALMVFSCIKLSKEDYQRVMGLFGEAQQKVLRNMVAFGVSYDKNISKSTKNVEKAAMDRARQLLQERSIPSERFNSVLEITIPQFISIMEKDKYGKDRKVMSEIAVSAVPEDNLPRFDQNRLICFMVGGLSQNQICNIRKDHSLDSILLASDQILTPQAFVESLSVIDVLSK